MGRATALELSRRGARLAIADIDLAGAQAVADEAAGEAIALQLNVTDLAACELAVAATLAHYGRIDIGWANAGISAFGPLDLLDSSAWKRVMDVNLTGAYNTTRALVPPLLASRGYLGLTCSWANFSQQPGHTAYAASKNALEGLANALRNEVVAEGVDVGTFHPGWIATYIVSGHMDGDAAYQQMFKGLPKPFDRTVSVDEIVPSFVRAFEKRSQRMIYPRIGWLLHTLRPVANSRLFNAGIRKNAPAIRAAFLRQQAEVGADTGVPERYRG